MHWPRRRDEDDEHWRSCVRCERHPDSICGPWRSWGGHGVGKGIKAIVVDDANAVPSGVFDEALLREAGKALAQAIMEDPKTENRHHFGTPAILMVANEIGILPTRNFSAGQFEKAEEIAGERVAEVIAERGGEGRSGTPCVRGCVIPVLSNIFPDPSGKKTVASIQYENIALLGPNCGIGDLDDIAELNHLCNQVGVDAIETGAAIGVAMEAGVIPFGDAGGGEGSRSARSVKGRYLEPHPRERSRRHGKGPWHQTGACHQGAGPPSRL